MIAFLDTSALVRRYLDEPGSARVRTLLRGHRKSAVSRLAYVELCAAVARSCRLGVIGVAQRDAVIDRLPRDFVDIMMVELRRNVIEQAPALLLAHPLRAADAIQLASCLSIRASGFAVELWSADGELTAAARAERLKTVAL